MCLMWEYFSQIENNKRKNNRRDKYVKICYLIINKVNIARK